LVSKLVRTPPPQAAGTTDSQSRVGNRKRPEAAASAKGSAKSPHCFTERPVRPISRLPSDDGGRTEKHSLLDGLDGRPFIANVGRSGGSIRGGCHRSAAPSSPPSAVTFRHRPRPLLPPPVVVLRPLILEATRRRLRRLRRRCRRRPPRPARGERRRRAVPPDHVANDRERVSRDVRDGPRCRPPRRAPDESPQRRRK
jgi:hypothetical protein